MMKPVYVFVDNSNLWIGGKKISGRNKKVPSNYNYRIDYGRLLTLVLEGRTLGDIVQNCMVRTSPERLCLEDDRVERVFGQRVQAEHF